MTTNVKTVKCLVWDLDNTVWDGTLAEGDTVTIRPYIARVMETLDNRGVLQSVASKNNHDEAWAKLEEFGIAKYIIIPKIGWGPKSRSLRQIAEALSFADGTIAFIDDEPAELEEVAFHLPQVRRYTAPNAAVLDTLEEFTPPKVTSDSRRRREMYQAALRRDSARSSFEGADELFVKSLNIELSIARAGDDDVSRAEELTLRTSQMNATGIHYDEQKLRQLCADPNHDVLVATMRDKLGYYGAIGIILLERGFAVWRLKLLATSCRVVSFGVGTQVLNWLTDQSAIAGVHLVADFRSTDRNRMMEIAYRFAGFNDDTCNCWSRPDDVDASVRNLHLFPERRPVASTMEINAVTLA